MMRECSARHSASLWDCVVLMCCVYGVALLRRGSALGGATPPPGSTAGGACLSISRPSRKVFHKGIVTKGYKTAQNPKT